MQKALLAYHEWSKPFIWKDKYKVTLNERNTLAEHMLRILMLVTLS